jgi:urease accessory protein UreF
LAEEAELAGRRAEAIRDEEIGSNLVGLALFSASHETLFSRLFRS